MWQYPEPRKQCEIVEDHFGTKVADPYRWMEDPDSDETKEFVTKQNAITHPFLSGSPVRDKFHKRMMEIYNYPKYGTPFKRGNRYYYFYNTGLQNQSVLYTQQTLDDEPKIFIDPNTLSEDGTVSLGSYSFSEDGKLFAYALSQSGSDWLTIKIKDVESGQDFDDELNMVKFTSIAWTHDGKGFFYQRYPDGKKNDSESSVAVEEVAVGTSTTKLQYQMVGMCYCLLFVPSCRHLSKDCLLISTMQCIIPIPNKWVNSSTQCQLLCCASHYQCREVSLPNPLSS